MYAGPGPWDLHPVALGLALVRLSTTIHGRLVGPRITTRSAISLYGSDLAVDAMRPGRLLAAPDLERLLRTALAGRLAPAAVLRCGDRHYYLPTRPEIALLLRASQRDRRQHLLERYDCDDFAHAIKGEMTAHAHDTGELRHGLCVGLAWGRFDWTGPEYHAVNWVVTSDEALWLIEPQTDDIYPHPRATGDIDLIVV